MPEKSAQALSPTLAQTKASASNSARCRLGVGLAKGLVIDAGAAM
jgi:hypothetical protein